MNYPQILVQPKLTKVENGSDKVRTGAVRLSYAYLFEPREAIDVNGKAKYQTALLIPKSDAATVNLIEAAIAEAVAYGVTTCFKGKKPTRFKSPVLRDGDMEDGEEYAGHWFVSAKSETAPGVVRIENGKAVPVTEDDDDQDFGGYSGQFVQAVISFFPYNHSGPGVACRLNNLLIIGGGEHFGGAKASAADDFELEAAPQTDGLAASGFGNSTENDW